MTKRPIKLLPVWAAISAVVIIAGIILMCLLGFNTSPDRAEGYRFEVRYDVNVSISEEKEQKLEAICEEAFKDHNIEIDSRRDGEDLTYDMHVITYVVGGDPSADALDKAKEQIESKIEETASLPEAQAAERLNDASIAVEYHALSMVEGLSYEEMWRGAVALTVGAVVGLIYLGIRYGVANALTGLVLCAHDAVFTVSVLSIARIPVYAYSPLLYAAIAAVCSMIFWLLHCARLRDAKKDAALRNLQAAEAVEYAWENSWKQILILAAVLVGVFAIAGGVAVAGVRLLLLPAMLPAAVAAYSSVLLGPALHVYVKGFFDSFFAKHKPRYAGKKKGEKSAEPASAEN